MSGLAGFLSQPAVGRLGWTLVHFLWQGAAVAALLASALRILRNRSPNARYLVACAALLLMLAAPVATLAWLSRPAPAVAAGVPLPRSPEFSPPAHEPADVGPVTTIRRQMTQIRRMDPVGKTTTPATPWKDRLLLTIERRLQWFVVLWMAGVALLSIRLLADFVRVRRFRRRGARPVAAAVDETARRLAAKLHLRRAVRLFESALAEVPVAIGWLRPVILLPASLITRLSPAQLEAILAHELAHVRRLDYLVNVFQILAETLLFYHPAVYWASRRIRHEREICCDDLAVAVCGNSALYARALAELAESPVRPSLATAASGGSLLARIRRLLGVKDPRECLAMRCIVGVVPAAILIALAALAVSCTAIVKEKPAKPAGAAVSAGKQPLEYHPLDESARRLVRSRSVDCSLFTGAPPGVALPEFTAKDPCFAWWFTPLAPQGKLLVAFDRSAIGGRYDLLYVDFSCNGSLRGQEPIPAADINGYSADFGPVEITFPGRDGPTSYQLTFNLWTPPTYHQMHVTAACDHEGSVRIGGKNYFCLDGGAGRIPAGRYSLYSWNIERKGVDKADWTLTAKDGVRMVEVKAGEETLLDVGEPVQSKLSASSLASGFMFSQSFCGRSGETVSFQRNGGPAGAPVLVVAKKDGALYKTYNSLGAGERRAIFFVQEMNKAKGPFTATAQMNTPFQVTFDSVPLMAETLQVATQPSGPDAVALVWEINDRLPYDGAEFHTRSAAFVGPSAAASLEGCSFDVLAGLDGAQFTKIATVQGPANEYVHKGVTAGWIYYYKVVARDPAGRVRCESAVTLGAAGPNLVRNGDFEQIPLGPCTDKETYDGSLRVSNGGFEVAEGARPYSLGRHILRIHPIRPLMSYNGSLIPLSAEKRYLQGGWIQAPGQVWYGRTYYDKDSGATHRAFSYAATLGNAGYWSFVVQPLTPEEDHSAFRRDENGLLSNGRIAEKDFWMFPRQADRMAPMIAAFGLGAAADLWVVEAANAPQGAVLAGE